jgi:hypothetical protein
MLFDERLRPFPIVHRYRDDADAFLREFVRRSRKSGKLGVAVRTPGTAVEQDHTEPTGQIARQMDFAATGASKGKRGEDIVILQHHNRAPCVKCLALTAQNDPSPLLKEKQSRTMAVDPPAGEVTSRHRIDRQSLLPLAAL